MIAVLLLAMGILILYALTAEPSVLSTDERDRLHAIADAKRRHPSHQDD